MILNQRLTCYFKPFASIQRFRNRSPRALLNLTALLTAVCIIGHAMANPTRQHALSGELLSGSATGGLQEGTGMALRYTNSLQQTSRSIEYRRQSRFNDDGQQLSLQQTSAPDTRKRWTVGLNLSDSFLFPRIGASTVYEWSWNERLNNASRVGFSHQVMRDSRHQNSVLFEQVFRTDYGLVVQAGRLQGIASPGNQSFHANHVGLQYLSPDRWRAAVRRQWSREAFQALSDNSGQSNFKSQNLRLSTGFELQRGTWINLIHERYDSSFYERRQWGIGLEQSW